MKENGHFTMIRSTTGPTEPISSKVSENLTVLPVEPKHGKR